VAFDLDAALQTARDMGASDPHVKVPAVPRVRIDGELVEMPGYARVTLEDADRVREQVVPTTSVKRRLLDERGSADLSYFIGAGRFRVAAFMQRNCPSFVFRSIPKAPDAETLGLPLVLSSWADEQRGLVLVTGPTGSGKSTTCAALLDLVNERRRCHILTIEDLIEFLHPDKRALVCQRELGDDAPNYHEALRAALRQDPDVILVGEIRDEETAMTVLRAAETGHLVLSTMHTLDAAETVQRFVDLLGGRADLARQMLAGTLVGVSSQRLMPGTSGGRVLAAEVLVNSARMRDLIAEGAPQAELTRTVAAGEYYGMQTFDQDLLDHVRAGRVDRETAIAHASSAHDFKLLLMSAGVDEVGTLRRAEAMQPLPGPEREPNPPPYAA
jgi:twitching motility protein PilT